jgi:hypothetical protein
MGKSRTFKGPNVLSHGMKLSLLLTNIVSSPASPTWKITEEEFKVHFGVTC